MACLSYCMWLCRFDRAAVMRHQFAASCFLQKMLLWWRSPLQKCQFKGDWKLKAEKCQSTRLQSTELLLIIMPQQFRHPWTCYIHTKETRFAITGLQTHCQTFITKTCGQRRLELCLLLECHISELMIPTFGALASAYHGKAHTAVLVVFLLPFKGIISHHCDISALKPNYNKPSHKSPCVGWFLQ